MKLRQCQWGVAMAMLGACSAMSLGDGQIPDRATLDSLDVFRRFERAFPEAGAAINAALSGEPISAALGLLDVCEQQLGNAAAFPRAAAETVRRSLGRLAARV